MSKNVPFLDFALSKYAKDLEKPKITKSYLSIPSQLGKENTKFKCPLVNKTYRQSDLSSSLEWLERASLIDTCYNVSLPISPLSYYKNNNEFKVYLNDTGLLIQMFNEYSLKSKIIDNSLIGPAKGGIYENIISTTLVKKGYNLFYFKRKDNTQEIEFLMPSDDSIIPIEVKSSNNKAISLNNFMNEFKPNYGIKLINGNLGVSNNVLSLPIYMSLFLKDNE